ncbi:type 1 fimbrial protein subunit FimI [Leclercia adecarboxylata]|uniref:type 1 fimbrial protein subunit FimI n=1 Tax=Leclercia adecarboxylata TaxID=83655 RepID=UPI00202A46A4|nr:type 1 fimbrial protein subunit FimI [Leclercia adecarboxylata]URO00268.1 type 1 fimbrial protein subunit FimI [Leclercia adecarboxylata]
MKRTRILFVLWCMGASPAIAHSVVVDGGKVHIKGELVNGGCAVAPDSQSLRVDMGQYRTNSFDGIGSFSTVSVPFTLRLVDCSVDVSRTVGVMFQGATPAADPQVFMASSRPGESPVSSGVGLALFDPQQNLIVPNAPAKTWLPLTTRELAFHFSARYRVISEHLVPGNIQTDVWFTLVYP